MSGADEPSFDPTTFTGRARIFPLPNLVLFPHIMQPLHIFEQRFRDMFEDAIAGDHLIAMAHLMPGWEADYEGRPPVFPVACLGRVTTFKRLPDGRYNLLLCGVKRVLITSELDSGKSFREAEVELLEEFYSDQSSDCLDRLEQRLIASFSSSCPDFPEVEQQLDELRSEGICLGMLTDVLSYSLDLELRVKEQLLAELDVVKRAKMLLAQLESPTFATRAAGAKSPRKYPPDFSAN